MGDEDRRDGPPPLELLVRRVTWEAEGVVSLDLVDPAGGALPPWEAGAHLDLKLPSGLLRQYSLCGDIDDADVYRIAVLREPDSRGGSREVHDSALIGRRLTAYGPRNRFPVLEADRYLFLAGGIGITPILPMLKQAARQGTPWHLAYGGRTEATMAFVDEIRRAAGGTYDLVCEDQRGLLDLDAILGAVTAGTRVYCCGPARMIAAVELRCEGRFDPGTLQVERFTAPPAEAAEDGVDEGVFEVELARTGVTLTVPPDRSLLRVICDAVPTYLYSCEEGYCGTCEAKVLEGEPDHRDTVLTDAEKAANKAMMVCVGRSKSPRLVLDI
jgi:ferredoxin-NADP reductase